MQEKLLRAKAWMYFIPVFVIPQLLYHFMLRGYFSSLTELSDFTPDTFMLRLAVYSLVGFICVIPFYLWMWAVGNELPRYIPENLRVRTGFFNVALVSSFILSGVSTLLFLVSADDAMAQVMELIGADLIPEEILTTELLPLLSGFKVAGTLMLIGFGLSLYCYYFSAKTISKARLQNRPDFSDNLINFLLHFVFFGSVWYFQPEIKKVMDKHGRNDFDSGITNLDDILDDNF